MKGPRGWIVKIVIALTIAFVLFYLLTRPEDAASAVKSLFEIIKAGFGALGRFFGSLVAPR